MKHSENKTTFNSAARPDELDFFVRTNGAVFQQGLSSDWFLGAH